MPDEQSIFNVARRLAEPDARRAYLEQVCGGDEPLHSRMQALLHVHDEQQGFLAAPAASVGFDMDLPAPPEDAGTAVGRYKLLQQIGEGGFGAARAVLPACTAGRLLRRRRDCYESGLRRSSRLRVTLRPSHSTARAGRWSRPTSSTGA